MSSILDRVRGVAADIFHLPASRLTAEASPETIATWDSVEHLNLVVTLEQEFSLKFAPEEIEELKSIGKIAEVLERKTQQV